MARPMRTGSDKLSAVSCQLSGRQAGFTYLGLLFVIALMGATLALTGVVWHTVQQREKERELLFIGQQFRQAISAYYNRSAGTVKQFPKTLDELLKDQRQLTTQRYLRRIYRDPMTGQTEWGLVKTRDDRIMGIYSLSENTPIKQGNFREAEKEFEGKAKYLDWRFVYTPPQPTPQAIAAPPPALTPPVQPSQKPPIVEKPPALTAPHADSPGDQASAESLCDTLLKNDASVCQTVVSKYGEESGQICAASAEERFAECRLKQTTVGLPPLQIQFDQ